MIAVPLDPANGSAMVELNFYSEVFCSYLFLCKKPTRGRLLLILFGNPLRNPVPLPAHLRICFLCAQQIHQKICQWRKDNIEKKSSSLGSCRNSFLGVFFLFLARIAFQSSFFSESRSFTRPLFCFFVPDLDRLAGQRIQIFFVFSFCSRSGSRFF